jgi:S-adenosylmethionine synthetase
MEFLVLSRLEGVDGTVEIVERKGLGHPDTICDALAEELSRNLCRAYRERFGEILHHNVDKALLCGGRAAPAFGGGSVLNPISIYLAGRATAKVNSNSLDLKEIAIEGSRSWLRANLHALDADRDVRFRVLVEPGSQDLRHLFSRRHQLNLALANDTSIGVGHAPLTPLEVLVLSAERQLQGRDRERDRPAWGEDVKIMALRSGDIVHLTVACAMIGRYLAHMDDYLAEKAAIEKAMLDLAARHGFSACEVSANAADHPSTGNIYLTVTGTSAEAGDDGQVGRGNRVNGLITPCRRMSLEAAAGKNPVTHVGKIYNVLANELAQTLVRDIAEVAAAECLIASRIGRPLTTPAILRVGMATKDGSPVDGLRRRVEDVAASCLSRVPRLADDFVAGAIKVF